MIHPYGVVATLLLWTAQGTPLDGTWLLTRIFRGGSPATTRAVPLDSTVYIRMSLESHTGGWLTGSLYRRYFGQPEHTKLGGGPLRGRARSAPLAHLRHGTAHRALAHSGSAAAPALRAYRAAARVAQLAPRPRRRQRAAEPGRHHLQRAAPRHDVPGPQFSAVSVGQLGLRSAGRGRFEPARARRAAVRGTTATEVVPAAGDGERGRQDRAAVRRAGGLAE